MAAMRVGMEIGNGRISMGVMDEHGSILSRRIFSGTGANSAERFADTLCDHLEDMLLKRGLMPAEVEHIGIGVAGVVDPRRGVVEYAPAMFGAYETQLAKLVEERVGVLPTIVREGWAAAYAELCFGKAEPEADLLCVTLGRSIGCGVVLGGKLYAGAMGTAGELAHMSVERNGRACPCGGYGCLERYISGTALLEQAKERFPAKLPVEKASWRDVLTLAGAGDAEATALIADGVDRLAFALANAIDLLGVRTVVMGGVLSEYPALIIDPLQTKVPAYGHPFWATRHTIDIRQAALGGDAAMVGAAFLTPESIR